MGLVFSGNLPVWGADPLGDIVFAPAFSGWFDKGLLIAFELNLGTLSAELGTGPGGGWGSVVLEELESPGARTVLGALGLSLKRIGQSVTLCSVL